MMLTRLTLSFALCASTLLAVPNQISWVASFGVDNGTCGTRVAPCRTFDGAIANTVAGGVVKAIDAGDYSLNGNQLTIQKAITIDGAGAAASFTGTTHGILVGNVASGVVTIRNLTINSGPGSITVSLAGGAVHIENSVITGAAGSTQAGIWMSGGTLTTDHVTITCGFTGLLMFAGKANLRNTIIRGSTSAGVLVVENAIAIIEHSELSNNFSGVVVDNLGKARISDSSISFNGTGLVRTRFGQILSYGNNVINDNTDDGVAPTLVPLK